MQSQSDDQQDYASTPGGPGLRNGMSSSHSAQRWPYPLLVLMIKPCIQQCRNGVNLCGRVRGAINESLYRPSSAAAAASASTAEDSTDEEEEDERAPRGGGAAGKGGQKKKRRYLLPPIRGKDRCGWCHHCVNPKVCCCLSAPCPKAIMAPTNMVINH